MAPLRSATEARWHRRHLGVVDHSAGPRERALPGSYPRQPADTIGTHRSALPLSPARSVNDTANAARTVAAAFIFCRLDYCNSLLYGLPDTPQYCRTAQVAVCAERRGTTDHWHATSWSYHAGTTRTPIRERVKFKVACLVRQSLSGQAPLYLADDCCLLSDSTRRSLRSADVPTCVVPRTLSSYDDRISAAAGPHL